MATLRISYYLTISTVLIGISLAASPITQSSTTAGPQGQCLQVDSCKCSYPNGDLIDLSPLSRTDGTAYFSNITNKHGDVFLWNPCNSFSYPKGKTTSTCGNVAVCMRLPFASPETMYSLGTQRTAIFTQDQGGLHIIYATAQGGHSYVANIILRCNHTLQNSFIDADTYQPYVTNTTSIYNLILNSKHACSYSPSSSGSSTIMSTSSSSTSSSSTSSSSPSSSGSSTIMSTSSSNTPKTSSPGSYQTSTPPSETSETSPVSTDSTRKSSTPIHTTTSPSGSAAMPLRRLNSFVLLCFTLLTFNLI